MIFHRARWNELQICNMDKVSITVGFDGVYGICPPLPLLLTQSLISPWSCGPSGLAPPRSGLRKLTLSSPPGMYWYLKLSLIMLSPSSLKKLQLTPRPHPCSPHPWSLWCWRLFIFDYWYYSLALNPYESNWLYIYMLIYKLLIQEKEIYIFLDPSWNCSLPLKGFCTALYSGGQTKVVVTPDLNI